MIELDPTADERTRSQLSPPSLTAACDAIRSDGCLLLRQVVPRDILATLEARMQQDTHRLLEFLTAHGGNPRTEGHLQQGAPRDAVHLFPEVIANPFAVQIARTLLGQACYLAFYNGNTNCPGSHYQAVHLDYAHLWRDTHQAAPSYSLVANIPTGDCTTANGAVELWPGTHRIAEAAPDNNIPLSLVEERRHLVPPVQAASEQGDLLLRDTRLWHRGVPNPGVIPRQMIAAVYMAPWYQRAGAIRFASDCQDRIAGIDFDLNATFDDDYDYLLGPSQEMLGRQGKWRNDRAASQELAENR